MYIEVPFMRFIVLWVGDERLELVVDAARLAGVARRRLQRHWCGTVRRQLEVERVRSRTELADQTFLQPRQRPLRCARRWEYLHNTKITYTNKQQNLLRRDGRIWQLYLTRSVTIVGRINVYHSRISRCIFQQSVEVVQGHGYHTYSY